MNRSIRGALALAAVLLAVSGAHGQPPEVSQPQSAPRPAPENLTFLDQGAHDPRLKGYRTPAGFKVEIVADHPVVTNPVGMTFGEDGALYVLEWRPDEGANFPEFKEKITYKDGTTRAVATMKKRVKDVVKVLRDADGDGVYDEAKVILEDELPSSILLHDSWLYLSGRGSVRRFRQSKPGGPYDVREVIAQGFCGFHHHQVSGLTIGNDGWLYITSGDDDNFVEGSDGSRATVLRTGAVFRCRPDGSKMHVYALGFRNPYRDLAFDAAFNPFHVDNDNEDGSKFTGCRLMHVAEEADFGWRLRTGARCCVPDSVRGAAFGELPGKMPALLKTGRGAPAGLLIYNESHLPEPFRGLLYYPDVFRKLIRAYRVSPQGSSFAVAEEFEFMKSDDPLFRPCQMVAGPDGAVYVCDWRTDHGGAGRLWGDGKHGRIYRVRWAGTEEYPSIPLRRLDSWAGRATRSLASLLNQLGSPNFSDRLLAQRELVRRGGNPVRLNLIKVLADEDVGVERRTAALGAVQSLWDEKAQEALIKTLSDPNADLRRLAAEALALNGKPGDRSLHNALLQCLGDADPAVRRAVALAMGKIGAPEAADALVNAFKFDDGKDVYLRDGLVRAVERLGGRGVAALLDLAESGADSDLEKVVEAFQGLRTRPGAEALPKLLRNPHLSIDQRAGLVRSYGNYLLDPPIALEPLLDYLTDAPAEATKVRLAGLEVLSVAGALKGPKVQKLVLPMLADEDAGVRLSAIRAVEDIRLTAAVDRLLVLLRDRNNSPAEHLAILQALRTLGDPAPVPLVKEMQGNPVLAPALRREAFRTLARLDPAAGFDAAKSHLDQKDLVWLGEAIAVLGTRPDGARLVGERFLAKQLPRKLLPLVADALGRHTDKNADLDKMLAEILKSGPTGKPDGK